MSATGISKEIETAGQLEELRQEVRIAAEELLSAANMKPGQILVVGCSSSEIASHKIGSYSSAEIGKAVFEELYAVTKSQGLYLAAQCCEHLNRALIVEEEAAEKYGLEMVNVVPQLKAGGSFATAAYAGFEHPTAVERIQAHAGIDIGDTFIGMHLRPVAVPVRTSIRAIGGAHVTCARTRLKYICLLYTSSGRMTTSTGWFVPNPLSTQANFAPKISTSSSWIIRPSTMLLSPMKSATNAFSGSL